MFKLRLYDISETDTAFLIHYHSIQTYTLYLGAALVFYGMFVENDLLLGIGFLMEVFSFVSRIKDRKLAKFLLKQQSRQGFMSEGSQLSFRKPLTVTIYKNKLEDFELDLLRNK